MVSLLPSGACIGALLATCILQNFLRSVQLAVAKVETLERIDTRRQLHSTTQLTQVLLLNSALSTCVTYPTPCNTTRRTSRDPAGPHSSEGEGPPPGMFDIQWSGSNNPARRAMRVLERWGNIILSYT